MRSFRRAALALALVCVAAPQAADAAPADRLFAADSIWNARLSANTPLDPTSRQRVRALTGEIRGTIARRNLYPNIQANRYSTPLYRVPANARRVRLTLDTGRWGDPLRAALAGGVPIPEAAAAASGSDGHMTVYQPATDTLWEFWRAHRRADGWHASWGGVIRGVSRNPGYYTAGAWPGLSGTNGWNWGSTATSLPVAAGTVTRAELRRGRVDHALAVAVANPCRKVFSWPAQRTDGTSSKRNCIPAGARLRLDPRVNLDRLRLPRVTRILAEAAQRHGMIVRDRTGGSLAFYLEAPSPRTRSPYTGARGLYRGVPSWRMLARFPFDRLQLLPLHLCSSSPCAPSPGRRSLR